MSDSNKKFYIDGNGNLVEKKKGDEFIYGLLIGLIIPSIVLVVLSSTVTNYGFSELLAYAWQVAGNSIFYPFIIMSLMPNMFVFFWMYKTERWRMTRGLVVATFVLFGMFAARAFIA
ncbi:MAG: hypothetical protein MJZ00_00580 [Paludibacteraceae bacterium]|nr:hypothetical protein [Paludibacteraceae bacterium]